MEQSFAEKLRIQALDRQTAIFENFINTTVEQVEACAEKRANEGYLNSEFISDAIPKICLSDKAEALTPNECILKALMHIENTLQARLAKYKFTHLYVKGCHTVHIDFRRTSVRTININCKW
jgi:hypothetical protein